MVVAVVVVGEDEDEDDTVVDIDDGAESAGFVEGLLDGVVRDWELAGLVEMLLLVAVTDWMFERLSVVEAVVVELSVVVALARIVLTAAAVEEDASKAVEERGWVARVTSEIVTVEELMVCGSTDDSLLMYLLEGIVFVAEDRLIILGPAKDGETKGVDETTILDSVALTLVLL